MTLLAEAFTLDWFLHVEGGPLANVSRWRDEAADEQVAAAIADCATLLRSPLSEASTGTLWSAATGGTHQAGQPARGWIGQVALILARRSVQPVAMPYVRANDPALRAEIADLGPRLRRHIADAMRPLPDDLSRALNDCAELASAELAFRVLIAATSAYFVPLTFDQYQRLVQVGERLHYSPFLVQSLEFLIA